MEESTVFYGTIRSSSRSTPLQSIQQLLAGDGLQTCYIAKGMDLLTGQIRKLTSDSGITYATAVHDRYVHVHIHLVEQIVQSVCCKSTGVGTLLTNQTISVFIVVVEGNIGVSDHFAQFGTDLSDPGIFDFLLQFIG